MASGRPAAAFRSAGSCGPLSRGPVGPEDRHHELVAVLPTEKGTPAGDTLGTEPHGLIGPARRPVPGKDPEPEPPGIGFIEDPVHDPAEQSTAVTFAWTRDRNPLQQGDPLWRGPIPENGESHRLPRHPADEIGMASVLKRGAMARFVPAPHEGFIPWPALTSHDEGDQRPVGADDLDLRRQAPPRSQDQMIRCTMRQRRSIRVKRKATGTAIPATTRNLTAAGQDASDSAYCSATTMGRWKR